MMGKTTIDRLIVNSPYEEPRYHWRYDPAIKLFDLAEGRRPAGYVVASGESRAFDDPGEHKRIAVKIVDERGIKSLKVMEVEL